MPESSTPRPASSTGDTTGVPPGPASSGPGGEAFGDKGVYKYLPLECPNCGYRGKVKIARLDQTFHCKQCGQDFHITRDGTVPGERPPDATPMSYAAAPVEEQPTWLEQHFIRLPPAAKWGVLGVLALVLVYGAVKLFEPAEPLPGELEDRAVLAAKAFAKGDWSTIKRLAAKGTTGDLGTWYEKQRLPEWDQADPEKIQVKAGAVKRQLVRYEKTTPIVAMRTKMEIDVPECPLSEIELIWSENKNAEFWLDGEKMVKESRLIKKKSRPKSAPDKDAEEEQPVAE